MSVTVGRKYFEVVTGIKETINNILLSEAVAEGTYVNIDQRNCERRSIYPKCIINSVATTVAIYNKL